METEIQNIVLFVKAILLTGLYTGVGIVFALIIVWELVGCFVDLTYDWFHPSR